ncbi:MAG: DUF11 domain-containing protein, partial [Bacteroidetes bacterium]
MRSFTLRPGLVLVFLFVGILSWGQSAYDLALRHIQQQHAEWGLTAADVADMVVSDQYTSSHNGVTHIYFQQRHQGIEVFNALINVNVLPDGRILHVGKRFVADLASRVNATQPVLTPEAALLQAAQHFGVEVNQAPRLLQQDGPHSFLFEGGALSHADIPVKLKYQPLRDGSVRLAWDLALDLPRSPDYWSVRVDALTGEILQQNNWTVECAFDGAAGSFLAPVVDDCDAPEPHPHPAPAAPQRMNGGDGATYNVFAVPVESPIHGTRSLVTDPADSLASPYGWHDIDGNPGAELTITRGNNVHAYLDTDADNISDGGEPDGGPDLFFDFTYHDTLEPADMQDAATVQLFYMSNVMHDLAYSYGMNEPAGAFQQNNYGNGGIGGDPVNSEAQDGGGTNNANFSTPPDGSSGRMQMFLWNASSGDNVLTVTEPTDIAGLYAARPGAFGGPIPVDTPLVGEVALVNDGSNQPTLGCNELVNGDEIAGKIAMIDRGSCEFGRKSLNAENAGAIAVIVCNFEDALVTMGAGAVGDQVTIPAVFMRRSDCEKLKVYVGNGLLVQLQAPTHNGPTQLDGDFDNGIIAHEYGHGISNRLTGGPSNTGCLFNDEQMGEGWSDFFSLITTVKPGDTGELPRGIGNYATSRGPDGGGIRRFPYSTDFAVNGQVYDDIIGTGAPHPLGEVWAAVLWDLYWKFVEVYGWDPDLYHGSGGNNMAIQLVFDGMKMQPCQPGFIDGRDAILKADTALYDGAHGCLIWEVFARRGFGWSADQGSSDDRNDHRQAFDLRPECIKELKVEKEVTDFITAGAPIDVTLRVFNHKEETATNVVLTDEIPEGASFVAGSASAPVVVNGDLLVFELGDLAPGTALTITYQLATDPTRFSIQEFFDDVENGDANFDIEPLEGSTIWEIADLIPHSGSFHWYIPDEDGVENDQTLFFVSPFTITGDNPAFRFYHRYDTKIGFHGGFLEISVDGGPWEILPADKFIRGGYRGKIGFQTFAIPFLDAFWGNSNGYIASYIDLSEYVGRQVNLRFRFGTDDNSPGDEVGLGWLIDDVELMDLFFYNGQACVTSDQGDQACTTAPAHGTIVESDLMSA